MNSYELRDIRDRLFDGLTQATPSEIAECQSGPRFNEACQIAALLLKEAR